MAQMPSLAWGRGTDGETTEFLQLARCEGVTETASEGAEGIFNSRTQRESALRDVVAECRTHIDRLKDEIDLFRDRMWRVRKMIRKLEPAIKDFPYRAKVRGEDWRADVYAACPDFVDENMDPLVSGLGADLAPEDPHGLSSDDEADVPKRVDMWVEQKVESMLLYGEEIDYKEVESETEDEAEMKFLKEAAAAQQKYVESQPGYDKEKNRQEVELRRLRMERAALRKLISTRELDYKAYRSRLEAAQVQDHELRMRNHYLCRFAQLRAHFQTTSRELPDFKGTVGPQEFDRKSGGEEEASLENGDDHMLS